MEGRERAALRYAKVIHDEICQLRKWLPFAPLPRVFYQLEESMTESLLNSDCLSIQVIPFLLSSVCARTGLDDQSNAVPAVH